MKTENNSGKKGSPTGLFVKTEPDNTNILNTINTKIFTSKNDQRKIYNIARSLSKGFRKYAFDEHRKKADIVWETPGDWLKKQGC